jgi:hypothetical protein
MRIIANMNKDMNKEMRAYLTVFERFSDVFIV